MAELHRTSQQVVVVGAGPAGLTAAITLARHGIECLVVERRVDPSSLPRATVVSLRTMELMRSWGLEPAVRAGGNDVEWLLLECETLARAAHGTAVPVGYPTTSQSAVLSPTAPGCVPQDHLEAVLRDHFCSLPGAHLAAGSEATGLAGGPDGARVAVGDVATGRQSTVEARYLVAADGAHSAIRSALGITMTGHDHLAEGLNVQFRAPLWHVVGEHRYGIYGITHPDAAGAFLPAGTGDRWLYGIEWDPARERQAESTDRRLRRLLALATGVPNLAPRIERVGRFSFVARLAERFRHGNVFLVGDAAHRVTPRGGTGMNTAIADGFDLGWKLAWVLKGWARPSLLDTYEPERRPVVEHNLERSAAPDGSRRDPLGELHADLGGRIRHHWVGETSGQRSTLDLVTPGLTLFVGPHDRTWQRAAATVPGAVPITVRHLDRLAAGAMGIAAGGALLIRPDGVPAGSWLAPVDAPRRLADAVAVTAGHRSVAAIEDRSAA